MGKSTVLWPQEPPRSDRDFGSFRKAEEGFDFCAALWRLAHLPPSAHQQLDSAEFPKDAGRLFSYGFQCHPGFPVQTSEEASGTGIPSCILTSACIVTRTQICIQVPWQRSHQMFRWIPDCGSVETLCCAQCHAVPSEKLGPLGSRY